MELDQESIPKDAEEFPTERCFWDQSIILTCIAKIGIH